MSSADFSLTTFSPSGKLVQIEYALNAVQAGRTSLGIKATNGVVIASEKKIPSILVDPATVEKTGMLSSNVGVTYSGMGPDFRVLLNKGRKAAQSYYLVYKDIIPVTLLARELAAVMQEFTQSGGVRPFGVSLLVAGYDDEGPQLYQVSDNTPTHTTLTPPDEHTVSESRVADEGEAGGGVRRVCDAMETIIITITMLCPTLCVTKQILR